MGNAVDDAADKVKDTADDVGDKAKDTADDEDARTW